ncbi:hypothetical protein ACQKEN_03490 [Pseudomonas sp. NPDC078416]|uniref:hypothetical protein n=1 Tax=Pseudomonas sp. NPDC078416 TaxID=3390637 RepID=UPI003D090AC0
MNDDLRKNRVPFSLEEALCELDLSIAEFVDFVTWGNVSTIVAIPHDRTVRMYYENENFSFNPQNYQAHEREHQAKFLRTPSVTLKSIALGGRQKISRFDATISATGKSISTDEIHESIHNCFVEYNDSPFLTTARRNERIKAFYDLYTGPRSREKWFGITLPSPATPPSPFRQDLFLPSSPSALSWGMQSQRLTATHSSTIKELETDLQQDIQMEFFWFSISDSLPSSERGPIPIWVDRTNIFFLPSQIYDLQFSLQALPCQTPEASKDLDILNNAARLFQIDIGAIKDPERYWKENKETSKMVNYVRENIKSESADTLEYCIKVLVNDKSILVDPLPEVSISAEHPDIYSDTLKRLNEANIAEPPTPSRRNSSASERGERLERFGFKTRANVNLRVVLNKL